MSLHKCAYLQEVRMTGPVARVKSAVGGHKYRTSLNGAEHEGSIGIRFGASPTSVPTGAVDREAKSVGGIERFVGGPGHQLNRAKVGLKL